MNNSQSVRRYVQRETTVSIIVNVVIGVFAFTLVFPRGVPVPVWGTGQLAFDFVLQSFMVGLFMSLGLGAVTARKVRGGTVAPFMGPSPLPRSLFAAAAVLAVCSALIAGGLAAVLLLLSGTSHLDWWVVAGLKVVFSALLALGLTPLIVRSSLRPRLSATAVA